MKKIFVLFIISSWLISCSTTKMTNQTTAQEKATNLSQNDGSSYEKAIVINEQSESVGVRAEYTWLRQNYPGYKPKGQSMSVNGKKFYDIIAILTADGIHKKIYFDITKFYGKM